jgi:hypothetical protein
MATTPIASPSARQGIDIPFAGVPEHPSGARKHAVAKRRERLEVECPVHEQVLEWIRIGRQIP